MNLNQLIRLSVSSVALGALLAASGTGASADQTHKAKISAARAESVALKKYKGGKITGKTALENEEGKWQYAVMVKVNGKTHEVMVGADSGKIESEETVTAKEEAAEQKAEAAAKKHPKTGKTPKGAKTEKGEAGEKGEKD